MAIELQIGADIQAAVVPIKQLQDELAKLKTSLKSASDPTEINKLSSAIVEQKNKIQQALASTNAFATSTFGVSRATRLAHADLESATRSLEAFSTGSERGIDTFTNLVFTFERLKGATGTIGGAFAALGETLLSPAGILIGLSALSTLLAPLIGKMFGFGEETKKTDKKLEEGKKSADEFKSAVDGIFKSTAQEAAEVGTLVALLQNETETRERKLGAIKKLNEIAPETYRNLKLEGNAVVNLDQDYQNYLKNLSTVIAAKIKQLQLEDLIKKQLELQGTTLTTSQKQQISDLNKLGDKLAQINGTTSQLRDLRLSQSLDTKDKAKQLQEDINGVLKDLQELSKGVKVPPPKLDKPDKDNVKEFIASLKTELKHVDLTEINFPAVFGKGVNFERFKQDLIDKLKTPTGVEGIEIKIPVKAQAVLDAKQRAADLIRPLNQELSKIAESSGADFISAFGEGLGKAISGGGVKSIFSSLFNTLASAMKAFGEALIKFGVGAIAIKFLQLNPFLAIAAGVALIAASSAIPKFASGGIATKPTLGVFGEKGPEVLMPLNRLQSLLGGGMNVNSNVSGQFKIQGRDLVLLLARENSSQLRTT